MTIDWMPLIVTVATVFGAAATYAYQRRVDRAATLIEKRREIFASYILAVQHNLIGRRDNEVYQTAYANIFIYGTDDVVRAVSSFHNMVADRAGQIDGARAAEAYARMLAAMRSDCFSSSKLSTAEMKNLLPFSY